MKKAAFFKAGFAAVVGRPSTGKSTLINAICGQNVAVVSPVPQTTRNAIRGIVNREQGQLVLVDTPGVHLSERKFNRRLSETAFRTASESDMILYVLDASRAPGPEEEAIAERCQAPLVAAVNKMDLPSADFDRAAAFLTARFPALDANRIIPISAKNNRGMDQLLAALFDLAPEGEPFYPEDYYTDQEMDFRIAEIIRGAALPFLRQELPHAVYVEVADRELRNGVETQRLWVRAFIICERESQKGMIVGKDGKIIKAIGKASRKELNRIFDWKVDLDLRVKTGKDWRHNDVILRKLLDR
ncbi:MAG: GTPase Era [Spirochaetaceae bacterium]|jgi:GTP-binding protein Era|nr:GTPase Era [Spirochaetaceae bacterium]